MLDAKDKKKLRKEAQDRRSLFQIGKDGIGDKLIDTLEDSLRAHELVKLNLLKSAPLTTAEAAEIPFEVLSRVMNRLAVRSCTSSGIRSCSTAAAKRI